MAAALAVATSLGIVVHGPRGLEGAAAALADAQTLLLCGSLFVWRGRVVACRRGW